jgi:coenzyme PQQ biosynthesis protein PqqD
MISLSSRPRLSPKVRLRLDRRTGHELLLYPETGLDLNQTAAKIACLCTGENAYGDIVQRLALIYDDVPPAMIERDVHTFLSALAERGLLRSE